MEKVFYTLNEFEKWVDENKERYAAGLKRIQANTYYIDQVVEAARKIWIRGFDIIFRHNLQGTIIEVEIPADPEAEVMIFFKQEHIGLKSWTMQQMIHLEFDTFRMKEFCFSVESKINGRLSEYDPPEMSATAHEPDPLFDQENQNIGAA